jgi:hypothetical protein
MKPITLLLLLTSSSLLAAGDPTITSITPSTAASNGGTVVRIAGANLTDCPNGCFSNLNVFVDGQEVNLFDVDAGGVKVQLPPHAQGLVPVTVINFEGKSVTSSDRLTYVYPPLQADFETILFPIARAPFAGEFGALWNNRNLGFNRSDIFVPVTPLVCQVTCPRGPGIEAGSTSDPTDRFTHRPYDSSDGVLLYLFRNDSPMVSFNSRIEDLSRSSLTAGTEIPVIREKDFLTSVAQLLDIPLDPRFRQTLRIYEPTIGGGSRVAVNLYDLENGALLAHEEMTFPQPVAESFHPYPGYIQIGHFLERYPFLSLASRIRIEIGPLTEGLRYWAFVSITNNETQHVTLVTPH